MPFNGRPSEPDLIHVIASIKNMGLCGFLFCFDAKWKALHEVKTVRKYGIAAAVGLLFLLTACSTAADQNLRYVTPGVPQSTVSSPSSETGSGASQAQAQAQGTDAATDTGKLPEKAARIGGDSKKGSSAGSSKGEPGGQPASEAGQAPAPTPNLNDAVKACNTAITKTAGAGGVAFSYTIACGKSGAQYGSVRYNENAASPVFDRTTNKAGVSYEFYVASGILTTCIIQNGAERVTRSAFSGSDLITYVYNLYPVLSQQAVMSFTAQEGTGVRTFHFELGSGAFSAYQGIYKIFGSNLGGQPLKAVSMDYGIGTDGYLCSSKEHFTMQDGRTAEIDKAYTDWGPEVRILKPDFAN